MRKVSVRALRANLLKELDDLPFEITRNGKVIGTVCTQLSDLCQCVHNSKSVKKRVAEQYNTFLPYSKYRQVGK